MKYKVAIIFALMIPLAVSGCSANSEMSSEHRAALETVHVKAKAFGFSSGTIEKDCAVPFDCSANDYWHSTEMLASPKFTDSVICEKLFALGKELGFTSWRRDYHEVEESGLDQNNLDDGLKACVEAIGVNSEDGNAGQSEGVVLAGRIDGSGEIKIPVSLQINSVSKPEWAPESERGYYFLISTFEG